MLLTGGAAGQCTKVEGPSGPVRRYTCPAARENPSGRPTAVNVAAASSISPAQRHALSPERRTALSIRAVLVGLFRIDRTALRRTGRVARGPGQVREGLRYAWRHRELRACLFLVAVVGVFGQNFRVVLPVMATDVLGGDAAIYGYLTAAMGLGAVAGAFGAASREAVTGRALLAWTVVFGVVNLLTALVGQFALALVALATVGVANILFNTLARTLLQLHSAPEMQGRVMALHSLLFLGTTPIRAPLLGWVCDVGRPVGRARVVGLRWTGPREASCAAGRAAPPPRRPPRPARPRPGPRR